MFFATDQYNCVINVINYFFDEDKIRSSLTHFWFLVKIRAIGLTAFVDHWCNRNAQISDSARATP
jgi:hypothetical protein